MAVNTKRLRIVAVLIGVSSLLLLAVMIRILRA